MCWTMTSVGSAASTPPASGAAAEATEDAAGATVDALGDVLAVTLALGAAAGPEDFSSHATSGAPTMANARKMTKREARRGRAGTPTPYRKARPRSLRARAGRAGPEVARLACAVAGQRGED